MIKKLFSFLIVIILLSISLSSVAEGHLKEFEKLLTGEWEQLNWAGQYTSTSFGSGKSFSDTVNDPNYERYNFRNIKRFIYPDNIQTYWSILTEDSTGIIYLTLMDMKTIFSTGKISFSEDGSRLLIIPIYGEGMAIYQKVK